MKSCHLYIKSKDRKSTTAFVKFFLISAAKLNLHLFSKTTKKKIKKTITTILKSPHAHKGAQDQFETRHYIRQLSFYTVNFIKCIILLKKMKIKMAPDLQLKFKLIIREAIDQKFQMRILSLDNFLIKDSIYDFKKSVSQFIPIELQPRKGIDTNQKTEDRKSVV